MYNDYCVIALLLKNGISTQTHAGTKQMLGLHFVITGKLNAETGRIFATLFEKRHSSDYDDFTFYDKETLEKLYPEAKYFIETIEKLIES